MKPEIRFKDFSGPEALDWEQRKLIDEIELFGGLTYSPKDVVPSPGSLVLRSSNVKDGEISLEDSVYVLKGKATSTPVQLNDIIVVVRNGSRSLIGKHAIVKTPLDNAVIGAFMTGIRTKQPDFISVLMDSQAFKKAITENLGATINQITGGMLKQMVFLMPTSETEKTAIGNFFRTLDDAISLHQKKLEHLKKLKKSLLQNMFPKEGEIFPRLRFPEFTDAWEQCKLPDLLQAVIDFRGRTPKKLGLTWSEQGYLALSALNVKDGYIDRTVEQVYGNQELYEKWMGGKELRRGFILFTTEAPMGNVTQVPDNKGYILSQRTIALNTKKELISNDFLAVSLKSSYVFSQLTAFSSGGTAKGVSQKSLSKVEIRYPNSLEEQDQISKVFKTLQDTIALHQRQQSSLEQIKCSLLAKMFV